MGGGFVGGGSGREGGRGRLDNWLHCCTRAGRGRSSVIRVAGSQREREREIIRQLNSRAGKVDYVGLSMQSLF